MPPINLSARGCCTSPASAGLFSGPRPRGCPHSAISVFRVAQRALVFLRDGLTADSTRRDADFPVEKWQRQLSPGNIIPNEELGGGAPVIMDMTNNISTGVA